MGALGGTGSPPVQQQGGGLSAPRGEVGGVHPRERALDSPHPCSSSQGKTGTGAPAVRPHGGPEGGQTRSSGRSRLPLEQRTVYRIQRHRGRVLVGRNGRGGTPVLVPLRNDMVLLQVDRGGKLLKPLNRRGQVFGCHGFQAARLLPGAVRQRFLPRVWDAPLEEVYILYPDSGLGQPGRRTPKGTGLGQPAVPVGVGPQQAASTGTCVLVPLHGGPPWTLPKPTPSIHRSLPRLPIIAPDTDPWEEHLQKHLKTSPPPGSRAELHQPDALITPRRSLTALVHGHEMCGLRRRYRPTRVSHVRHRWRRVPPFTSRVPTLFALHTRPRVKARYPSVCAPLPSPVHTAIMHKAWAAAR